MTSTQQPTPVISAPCGPTRGFINGPVHRFTGIPYARAERFEIPIPAQPWQETFDAVEPGPACPQPHDPLAEEVIATDIMKGLKIDEHCQTLSVTTPADVNPTDKLPVMVWFHGGAFVNGAGDLRVYDPSSLVAENRVIHVSVTSRLNVFGYLGDGGSSRPANLGLLDVMESLRWVRKNIAAFGGSDDPKSITIFGQSAGGSTVVDIMTTDEATSLFGRVIAESAPFGITRNRAAMNKRLFELVRHASPSSSPEEMVQLASRVIKEGPKQGNEGGMPFAPQYGFAPLPEEAELDTILDARAPEIDLLVGYTAEEGTMFVDFISVIRMAVRVPLLGSFVHNAFVSWCTNMLYTKGAKSLWQRYVKAGGKASLYEITWGSKDPKMGATHAIELPLLFGTADAWKGSGFLKGYEWEEVDETGKKLRKLWADFAKGKQLEKSDSIAGLIDIA